jgi:hypothetical protein
VSPNGSAGRLVVAAVALLVIGGALGITADRLLHRTPRVIVVSHAGATGMSASLDFLDSVLTLTADQRAEVHRILSQRQAPIDSIWLNTHTALRATLDSVASAVVGVLDAGQKVRFHEVFGDWHAPAPNRHLH